MSGIDKVVGNVMNGGIKPLANKITTNGKSKAITGSIVNKISSGKTKLKCFVIKIYGGRYQCQM